LIINGESERETEEQVKKCLYTILDEDVNVYREDLKQSNFNLKFDGNSCKEISTKFDNTKRILMISGLALKYILKDE
jgi:hypothetical protein